MVPATVAVSTGSSLPATLPMSSAVTVTVFFAIDHAIVLSAVAEASTSVASAQTVLSGSASEAVAT